ncbi:MAG: hypothetical protein DRI71_12285 [Bacteroidetes bacterium]|nr:MAG: hypothetical protein DRI71_12285 [Bacteroidota bacterium]
MEGYKKSLFVGIIFIALGAIFSINEYRPLGTIFIAVGSLFLIVSMNKKRNEDQDNKNDD